jgi:hypothetical protein
MSKARVACLSALLVIAFAVPASAEPTAKIVAYGRYQTADVGPPQPAAHTVAGEVRPVQNHRLLQETDEIVGQLGNTFGVEIDLAGFPPGPIKLTIRTLHPRLTNSRTGKTMSVSEYDWTVAARHKVYFGFTFDDRWEIAEGYWTKQIIYNGKVLAQKRFKIIVPMN